MTTLRLLGAGVGCFLFFVACSGERQNADDDEDNAGSGGVGGSLASGGSTASEGTGGSGGTAGGSAFPENCQRCVQPGDCSTGFCNRVDSRDLDLLGNLPTRSEGRCTEANAQAVCNCGILIITGGDSICFGDCPDGVPTLFCENMSGEAYTAMAPVTPSCPPGQVSLLTEPVCAGYYTCMLESSCIAGPDYEGCMAAGWDTLAPATCYSDATVPVFPELCTTASRQSTMYPDCAL